MLWSQHDYVSEKYEMPLVGLLCPSINLITGMAFIFTYVYSCFMLTTFNCIWLKCAIEIKLPFPTIPSLSVSPQGNKNPVVPACLYLHHGNMICK